MPTPVFTPGAPCWIDLMTTDAQRAEDFYGSLLGWTFQRGDEELYGGYAMALLDGKPIAGVMQKQPSEEMPDVWTTYLYVENADESVAKVQEAGGQLYFGPMDVPEQGRMGVVGTPEGATVGFWEPGGHLGYAEFHVPGSPYWHESFTRDFQGSKDFYTKAFGWDVTMMSDTDEFRYGTLGAGTAAVAGLMDASSFLPEGVPAHWRVYFGVEDCRAAAKRVEELGGSVLEGPEDTPFGVIATVQDPMGGTFLLASGEPQEPGE